MAISLGIYPTFSDKPMSSFREEKNLRFRSTVELFQIAAGKMQVVPGHQSYSQTSSLLPFGKKTWFAGKLLTNGGV
jgi:hypothetical protein